MSDHNEIRKLSDRCSNLLRENKLLKKKIKAYDEFHHAIKEMIGENKRNINKSDMVYAFSVWDNRFQVKAS